MANSIHIGGGGSGSATLITKSITQNGTYLAQDDNADGYSEVTVDVAGGAEYVDISSFAHYYKRNTTTPTITPISSNEVSLTFQDQNATGYELCSFSVPLTKGLYVAEIYATIDTNTGLANRYTWGIYSSNTSSGASINDNSPMDNTAYDTYVPFDKSDTNEHYYEVPIKMLADGTAYICFAMADDNGVNATITVRSLKIRKAYGGGEGSSDVDLLRSNNPFFSMERVTGTNYTNVGRTWTFDKSGVLKFYPSSYARTNTGSNDGFLDFQLNGVSVYKQYLTTDTDTTLTLNDITISSGDTFDIVYGFDNYHSNCTFQLYTAISLLY